MKSITKNIYKHLFVLYNILTEGGENMKLTLRYNITKIDKKQKEIIEEIMWHATKVYNIVNVNIKMNIFSNLIMQKNLHFYIVIHHRF